jgi:ribonuclease P protein component
MSGHADQAQPRTGGPALRLKKRRDFLRVAARAKRAARPGLVLQAAAGEAGRLRVGFTVTRKVGNAVVRNRARRRLKEAARLTLPALGAEGWDLVLIGRDGTARRPFATLVEDLRGALRQAGVTPGGRGSASTAAP